MAPHGGGAYKAYRVNLWRRRHRSCWNLVAEVRTSVSVVVQACCGYSVHLNAACEEDVIEFAKGSVLGNVLRI